MCVSAIVLSPLVGYSCVEVLTSENVTSEVVVLSQYWSTTVSDVDRDSWSESELKLWLIVTSAIPLPFTVTLAFAASLSLPPSRHVYIPA